MYKHFKLQPPFFELGPKAYICGEESLELAKKADELSVKYDVRIIYTPQYTDIPGIVCATKHIVVFAQHMDPTRPGRGMGSVLPEALKAAGAGGTFLNHAERRMALSEINRAIRRADEVGLATAVCADTPEEAEALAHLGPNIIVAESPDLIASSGARPQGAHAAIRRINGAARRIDPDIHVLHGAGINSGVDVYDIVKNGAEATGSSSGVVTARDPHRMLEEMIRAMRTAWDEIY